MGLLLFTSNTLMVTKQKLSPLPLLSFSDDDDDDEAFETRPLLVVSLTLRRLDLVVVVVVIVVVNVPFVGLLNDKEDKEEEGEVLIEPKSVAAILSV